MFLDHEDLSRLTYEDGTEPAIERLINAVDVVRFFFSATGWQQGNSASLFDPQLQVVQTFPFVTVSIQFHIVSEIQIIPTMKSTML